MHSELARHIHDAVFDICPTDVNADIQSLFLPRLHANLKDALFERCRCIHLHP